MKYLKRFETCDSVKIIKNSEEIDLSWHDSIPFAVTDIGEVLIGEKDETHLDAGLRDDDWLLGRFYDKDKIISFWNLDKFKEKWGLEYIWESFFCNIFDAFDVSMDGWSIDLVVAEGLKEKLEGLGYFVYNSYYDEWCAIIPLKDFIDGSFEFKDSTVEKPIHMMNWEEKQALKKKGWGKGWGSDMTAWGGKNPLQWRQAKYQESVSKEELEKDNLEYLENEYFDKERAREDFDWFYNLLKDLDDKGGYLYRIVFLTGLDKLNQELGQHWTHDEDKAKNLVNNLRSMLTVEGDYEIEDYDPYLIEAKVEPGNIDFESSMNAFCNMPNEEEVNVKDLRKLKILSVENLKNRI